MFAPPAPRPRAAIARATSAIRSRWSSPRRGRRPRTRPDLVQIDYEPLPSVTATADATEPGAAPVWDECPDNISQHLRGRATSAATEAAFASAHRIVAPSLRDHAGARPVHGAARLARRLRSERRSVHALRRRAVSASRPQRAGRAASSRFPSTKIRVVAGDVGGAFGTKGWQYPEHKLVLWAARKLRPTGQVAVRAARGDPGRRARARQRERRRARARRRGPVPRPARQDARERRRATSPRTGTCSPRSATWSPWSASTRSPPPTCT